MATPLVFLAFILFVSSLGYKSSLAVGGRNDECVDAQTTGYDGGTEDSRSFTTPGGEVISGVCIKSGPNMFGDGHSEALGSNSNYELNDCYTVSGIGTTSVTVTRNFDSSECQGISHIDIYYSASQATPTPTTQITPTPTDDPSPTPTPTETITPTPTESVTPTPTEVLTPTPTEQVTPTPTDSVTPTPTGTITPTPTSTPTPTPTGQVAGTSTSSDSGGDPGDPGDPGDSGQVQGLVLGASTLAATGIESEPLFMLGMILIGISLYGYGAPKIFKEA